MEERLVVRHHHRLAPAIAALVAVVSVDAADPTVALAQTATDGEGPRLTWNDDWPRVRTSEIVTTSALALGAALTMVTVIPDLERWNGGILYDEEIRELRLRSREGRVTAKILSDWLQWSSHLYPYVDTAIVWADGNDDVALQMLGMNLLGSAISAFSLALSKNVVRRARPYVRECEDDPDYDPGCQRPDRYRSFFSGHAGFAFTGAGLTCAHHLNVKMYGGGFPDHFACGAAVTVATTTALLRILADKHYATDVLTGAFVGLIAGFALPSLLHYGLDWGN